MSDTQLLKLKQGKNKSLQRRHPWIFSGALAEIPATIEEGEIVKVVDKTNKVLATGYFGKGSIAVRVVSFGDIEPNEDWYRQRISKAYQTRNLLGIIESTSTDCFRLFHGEGDQIPGLVIDVYKDLVVVQAHHAGIEMHFEHIRRALHSIFGKRIQSVLLKTTYKKIVQSLESNPVAIIKENGIQFEINAETGQKTGFFLDQRDNRALVESFAYKKKILNAYSYSGGFSMYALRGEAKEVHSLDSSQRAIDLLEKNLLLNGYSELNHKSICADAIKYLNSDEARNEEYEIIILDPPAFAKSRGARHRAVQAYKRINSRAMKIIEPGGILFTFSCSQVVSTELFDNTIAAAAIEVGREARILRRLHQPADHPVNIYHPEGNYLKGLVLQID